MTRRFGSLSGRQRGASFVTRAKFNFKARRVYSAKVERATGVVCDQTMALHGYKRARDDPGHLGRVRFKDPTWSYCAQHSV